MISEFGETVTVTPVPDKVADDPNDTIYLEEDTGSTTAFDHDVRLYSAASDEMLQDYGFEEDTEAIAYDMEGKIGEGDQVEYQSNTWVVSSIRTNQIGTGPYVYVYGMKGV